MLRKHAHSQAEAIHAALAEYAEAHQHAPDARMKARIISSTITQWVHEAVQEHRLAHAAAGKSLG